MTAGLAHQRPRFEEVGGTADGEHAPLEQLGGHDAVVSSVMPSRPVRPGLALGHATIAEIMDTYGHLLPDSEDLGRGAIDGILARALTEQQRNLDVQ